MQHPNLERPCTRGLALAALLSFATATACSESAPSCSASSVTETVVRLARQATVGDVGDPLARCRGSTSGDCATMAMVTGSTGAPVRAIRFGFNPMLHDFSTAKLLLSAIRTREESKKRAQCAAHLQIEVEVRSRSDLQSLIGIKEAGNYNPPQGPARADFEIGYTVERTEDGKDYITLRQF